jgi:polysaccharide pyruvyl transferase WcaK-like protein
MNTSTDNSIVLFGASPDTGNQGVTALCYSVIDGLEKRNITNLCVYDHGRGRRSESIQLDERMLSFDRLGAISGKRYYRPDNLWQIRIASRMGGLWNENARTLCRSKAVLDVSGGDSFAEIYGTSRFQTIVQPKLIALRAGRPLILLPQTYGPFNTSGAKEIARKIVRGAHQAWARDRESQDQLSTLLGSDYDPARHRLGVDMAFGLPACRPRKLSGDISTADLLTLFSDMRPVIGFNVSGLLYNDPGNSRIQFGLRANYRTTILRTLRSLLACTDAHLLLVPHVVLNNNQSECDFTACRAVYKELGYSKDRVTVLPGDLNACELKWVIARTDWFCGTRMHATIAALSSGVPTMALAYSKKTRGVFDSCNQGEEAVELRNCGERQVIDRILDGWRRRADTRNSLCSALPTVLRQAASQMDAFASSLLNTGTGSA